MLLTSGWWKDFGVPGVGSCAAALCLLNPRAGLCQWRSWKWCDSMTIDSEVIIRSIAGDNNCLPLFVVPTWQTCHLLSWAQMLWHALWTSLDHKKERMPLMKQLSWWGEWLGTYNRSAQDRPFGPWCHVTIQNESYLPAHGLYPFITCLSKCRLNIATVSASLPPYHLP